MGSTWIVYVEVHRGRVISFQRNKATEKNRQQSTNCFKKCKKKKENLLHRSRKGEERTIISDEVVSNLKVLFRLENATKFLVPEPNTSIRRDKKEDQYWSVKVNP